MALACMLDRLPRVMGGEVSAGCRSLCLVRGHPPWLRTPESAATARDDVLASQEQNRWAVRSHWCFGTRTRIRRCERFTAVAYEHYAFYLSLIHI